MDHYSEFNAKIFESRYSSWHRFSILLRLLLLAGRQTHTRFHPLQQSALGIANGAADFHIGWPVASHPSLGQPGFADAQKIGRISWGE